MSTWRFISCRRIRYRNYRTHIGVGPTACRARSTLDRPCPSHGQPGSYSGPEVGFSEIASISSKRVCEDRSSKSTSTRGQLVHWVVRKSPEQSPQTSHRLDSPKGGGFFGSI